jgi:hypothetical protein
MIDFLYKIFGIWCYEHDERMHRHMTPDSCPGAVSYEYDCEQCYEDYLESEGILL